jgi:hypothetical protein
LARPDTPRAADRHTEAPMGGVGSQVDAQPSRHEASNSSGGQRRR